MRSSGAMGRQAKVALEMIKANPGKSTKELGEIGPLDRYQVARRCPELREAKLVWRLEQDEGDCLWYPR